MIAICQGCQEVSKVFLVDGPRLLCEKCKMAIGKTWIADAVDEIDELIGNVHLDEGHIAEVIAKHCPFQPDVAYMPVPRCDGCRHWETLDHMPNVDHKAVCGLLLRLTSQDFGCTAWEAK